MRDHFVSSLCFLLIQSDSFSWLAQTASGHRRCGRAQQSDLDSSSSASSLTTDALLVQSQPAPLHPTSNSSSLAACEPSVQVHGLLVLAFAVIRSLCSSRSLGFTVCVLQSVHAGGRMTQGEKSYVLYSQTVQGNADRRRRGRGRKGARGNSLQRDGLLEPESCRKKARTLSPPHILHIYTHRGWIVFRRAVLELYSRPCALSSPTLWMDGWMEDRAKCFYLSASIVRSGRKDILPDTTRHSAGGKKKRIHSF